MSKRRYTELYEIILDVIEPKLSEAGYDRSTVNPDMNLSTFLDSFGLLEAIMDIETAAEVSADLGEMDFEKAMTIGGLANEIIRINT